MSEGACVFVKKGTFIAEKGEGDGWCVVVFFLPDSFLQQFREENHHSLPLKNLPEVSIDQVLPMSVNDLSRSFFYSMLPYFTQPSAPPERLLELKFNELLLSLLTNPENGPLLTYLTNLGNTSRQVIEEVMEANYTFNLTLEQYANLACKSLATFKREFKKNFKSTPAKWVLRKRLNLAAELLQNSQLSITDVTYECGFENQTHFSRVFKHEMGVSPLHFRQQKLVLD